METRDILIKSGDKRRRRHQGDVVHQRRGRRKVWHADANGEIDWTFKLLWGHTKI